MDKCTISTIVLFGQVSFGQVSFGQISHSDNHLIWTIFIQTNEKLGLKSFRLPDSASFGLQSDSDNCHSDFSPIQIVAVQGFGHQAFGPQLVNRFFSSSAHKLNGEVSPVQNSSIVMPVNSCCLIFKKYLNNFLYES